MIYRYPANRLVGDYVRAGAGLMLTAGPALMVSLTLVPLVILLLLAALFFGYARRRGFFDYLLVSSLY